MVTGSDVSDEVKTVSDSSYQSTLANLHPDDIEHFLRVVEQCHDLENVDAFKAMIQGPVRKLIPHEIAVCGIGERGALKINHLVNVDFPSEYLKIVMQEGVTGTILKSPVAKTWADKPAAHYVGNFESLFKDNPKWVVAVQRFRLKDMLVNGLTDIAGSKTSYFCFARCQVEITEHHKYIMDILTPHLHKALTRLFESELHEEAETHLELTNRETEILHWLYLGYTNLDIASQLEISSNTVKNHVQNIFRKLDANNRVQAISKALTMGVLEETI